MKENQEIMVLSHQPWVGFRKAFVVIFALACVYLGGLLFLSFKQLDSTGASHEQTSAAEVKSHD